MEQNSNKEISIAYYLEDKQLPPLPIRYSANAWWMNKNKLWNVISAFKIGATIREACAYAGITLRQYKYFYRLHPEITEVKLACRSLITLRARKAIVDNIDKPRVAMWFLERKLPEEFSKEKRLTHFSRIPTKMPERSEREKEMSRIALENVLKKYSQRVE